MTNVLFCYQNGFYCQNGGVQRFCSTLGEFLSKKGMNVFYLSLLDDIEFKKHNQNTCFHLPDKKQLYSNKNKLFYEKLLRNLEIDVIINNETTNNRFGFFANIVHKNQVKQISVFHQDPLQNINELKASFSLLNISNLFRMLKRRKFLKNRAFNSDKLVFLSESFVEELKNKLFLNIPNVFAINNFTKLPINVDLYNKKNELLYVGRLSEEKQVDILIRAWRQIEGLFDEWSLIIVGDGEERTNLEHQVAQLELKRICFVGRTNPESFYLSSKIIVLPSRYEGFGLVLIEAMSFGVVPVVFNNWISIRDIVDGNTGIIVDDRTELGLFNALKLMIKNKEFLYKCSVESLNKARLFDINLLGEKWLDLIVN